MDKVYLYVKDVTNGKVQYIAKDFGLRKASFPHIDRVIYGNSNEIFSIINTLQVLRLHKKDQEIISIINSVPVCPEMGEYAAVQEMKRIAGKYGVNLKSNDFKNALNVIELYGFCRPDDYFECFAKGRTVCYQFEEIRAIYLHVGTELERNREDIKSEYSKCCFCWWYKDPSYYRDYGRIPEIPCWKRCGKRTIYGGVEYRMDPVMVIRKAREEGVSVYDIMDRIEK